MLRPALYLCASLVVDVVPTIMTDWGLMHQKDPPQGKQQDTFEVFWGTVSAFLMSGSEQLNILSAVWMTHWSRTFKNEGVEPCWILKNNATVLLIVGLES